jgi:hypothetical protein
MHLWYVAVLTTLPLPSGLTEQSSQCGDTIPKMSTDKKDLHRPNGGVHTSPFSSSFFAPAKLPKRASSSTDKPVTSQDHSTYADTHVREQKQGSVHTSNKASTVLSFPFISFLSLFSPQPFSTPELQLMRSIRSNSWAEWLSMLLELQGSC